jgi:hypothetical protein
VEADSIAIPPRRWLEFIPEPRRSRGAAVWGLPVAGVVAIGLLTTIMAAGGEAQGNESDGLAIATTEPDALPAEEIAPASAIAPAAPIAEATVPAVTPPTIASRSEPVTEAEPAEPVRKRRELPPMKPAELRKAQRVARQLSAAVAEGRVQTSSLSLAVVADREGTFWSEASTMCNELVVDGVSGWRLPSVGELRDLGRARVLPGAPYWSRSRGRDPETAHVYNTRTRRSGTWLQGDPTGATVCVQPRPRVASQ